MSNTELRELANERNRADARAANAEREWRDSVMVANQARARYTRKRLWEELEAKRKEITRLEDRIARISADNPEGAAKPNIMAIDGLDG